MYLFIYLFAAPIIIEENRLRYFGYVKRMARYRLPQRIIEWKPDRTRINGRHQKTDGRIVEWNKMRTVK
jgi:hypothetical protein